MYILGHVFLCKALTTVDFDAAVLAGARPLMLPDFADTHAFAYTHAWKDKGDVDSRLIRCHIAGDWWVHFGDRLSEPARRRGWAYLRMGTVCRRYQEFYGTAHALGLVETPVPNDSRRGWAHSMLEYSIDTYIARQGWLDDAYEPLKNQLGELEAHSEEVERLLVGQQVTPVDGAAWGRARTYSQRVRLARSPEELALLGAVGKFGLRPERESVEYVRSFQSAILTDLGADEYDGVLAAMTAFVAGVDTGSFRPVVPGPPIAARRAFLADQHSPAPGEASLV